MRRAPPSSRSQSGGAVPALCARLVDRGSAAPLSPGSAHAPDHWPRARAWAVRLRPRPCPVALCLRSAKGQERDGSAHIPAPDPHWPNPARGRGRYQRRVGRYHAGVVHPAGRIPQGLLEELGRGALGGTGGYWAWGGRQEGTGHLSLARGAGGGGEGRAEGGAGTGRAGRGGLGLQRRWRGLGEGRQNLAGGRGNREMCT